MNKEVTYKTQKHQFIDKNGYVWVYIPTHPQTMQNGYALEHRLIMSEFLGRVLTTPEHVHHINGNTQDNRIENLELMTASKHTRMNAINAWIRGAMKKTLSINGKRQCATCHQELPISEFWHKGGKYPHLLQASCKNCQRKLYKERSHRK